MSEFVQELNSFINIPLDQYDKFKPIVDTPTDGLMPKGKFKIIEIIDESNTVNIKVNDIIELSEKMKSRIAGGFSISKEDKLIATVQENVGLRIIESIRID